jgi:hypothetical protein
MHDALVVAWGAKYAHNRPRPPKEDPTLDPAVAVSPSPSYPCEHATAAGGLDRPRSPVPARGDGSRNDGRRGRSEPNQVRWPLPERRDLRGLYPVRAAQAAEPMDAIT